MQILKKLCENIDIQRLLDNGDPSYDPHTLKWDYIRPEVYYPKVGDAARTYILLLALVEMFMVAKQKKCYMLIFTFIVMTVCYEQIRVKEPL